MAHVGQLWRDDKSNRLLSVEGVTADGRVVCAIRPSVRRTRIRSDRFGSESRFVLVKNSDGSAADPEEGLDEEHQYEGELRRIRLVLESHASELPAGLLASHGADDHIVITAPWIAAGEEAIVTLFLRSRGWGMGQPARPSRSEFRGYRGLGPLGVGYHGRRWLERMTADATRALLTTRGD